MRSVKASKVLGMSAILIAVSAGLAFAQLDNRPFSFKNSPGGMGMSQGGRQAIINDKIFDSRPDNMLRGPDGLLLDVIKGPGNVVIVQREGNGGVLPGYRGTDFRGHHDDMQAGVYNLFFANDTSNYNNYRMYNNYQTAAIIGAWIASVAPGASYDATNPVTSWTVFVYNID